MKQSLALLLVVFSVSLSAQDRFEGLISYGITLDGENASMLQAYMPESYDFYLRDGSMRLKMNGGMMETMMGEILNVNGGGIYMLKEAEKVAYEFKDDNTVEKPSEDDYDV